MDFMKTAKWWGVVSVVIILAGLVSMAVQGLNVGIDFKGGTYLDLKFERSVTTGEIRQAMGSIHENAVIQETDEDNEYLIRTISMDADQRTGLMTGLKDKLGNFEIRKVEEVKGVISRELTEKAVLAVAIACILQIIYIALRFDFKFGVTAVIALVHDAAITLGLMSLFQMEIGSAFVAAILTVIGYSMNDTIVVFDRIRENLKLRKRESLTELVNKSINQTLSRTINTAVTTLLAVGAILIFGGDTVRDFVFAMFVGMVSGVYSSVFIASPLWLWWTEAAKKARKTRVA